MPSDETHVDPRSMHPASLASALDRRRLLFAGLSALATGALAQGTEGQPVSLIVPLAPGGIADITARPLAIPLARELGRPVIVDNKIGAGGAVGISYVGRQKPDGNTLLMALSSIVVIPEADRVAGRTPSYDLEKFAPIALITADPTVLVVRADSPLRTIDDLIKAAKARPGAISFSSSGLYGTTHICQAMLWQAAGIEMLHVPYNGGGPSMTALLGGQVEVTAQAPGTIAPHLKADTVRVLGSWGVERLKMLPEIKTFREQGLDVEFYIWSALFAPAGIAPAKLEQLRSAARKSVQDPGFQSAMATMNTPIRFMEGDEFARFLEKDRKRMAAVVKAMGKIE